MTTALVDFFWFIVTFSILVVLHEGGHFLVARAFGVHVHEFMIGLPGPSIRFRGKKTDYGVTAIPLGGYVRISGMDPGPEDERLATVLAYVTRRQPVSPDEPARDLGLSLEDADILLATLVDWAAIRKDEQDPESFDSNHSIELAEDPTALLDLARSSTYRGLPAYKRILVLSAGVVVNLLSAILVFVLVLTLVGLPEATLTIGVLTPSGGAAKAGLKVGDTIQSIDGQKLADWNALVTTVSKHHAGARVTVVAVRDGVERTMAVTLGSQGKRPLLGVQGTQINVPQSLPQAISMSFGLVGQVFVAIGGFFGPSTFQKSVQSSAGVIGIAVMAGRAAQRGPIDFAAFVAVLSLSLGVMNILPIPPLDGGKIVLEIIEAARRRPLPRKVSLGVSLAGAAVLFALIGYLMYADIINFIVKGG